MIQIIPKILALLTILAQIIIIGLAFLTVWQRFTGQGKKLLSLLAKQGYWIALAVALAATGGSLFFSEVLDLPPCHLCWYQRIFIYPQVLLLGLALIIRDKKVWYYIAALSLGAVIIALYQYLMQQLPGNALVCSINGPASCGQVLIYYFGYITIPLMSLTAGLINLLVSIVGIKHSK
jgi:disulfide bond formation protein DsbB